MAMGSWIVKCHRVELEGIVKVWISFSSTFRYSLENHSCTRDKELFVLFNGNLSARAARILVSNENPLKSGGRTIAFAELMLG